MVFYFNLISTVNYDKAQQLGAEAPRHTLSVNLKLPNKFRSIYEEKATPTDMLMHICGG
jgi:outer membrane lipoprotein-sorting protein